MPNEVLYGVIGFLGLAVIALGGLWVKSHDAHRQWATEKINEVSTIVAVMQSNHKEMKDDLHELKNMLQHHLEVEEKYQKLMMRKFNLSEVK